MTAHIRDPPKMFAYTTPPSTSSLSITQGIIMNTSVFCIASTESEAQAITNTLCDSGFARDDISVLFPDRSGTRDFAHEQHTKAPEGTVAGASTGGILGGAVGWVVGIGALAIPGVGPFIAAGPIVAMLAGTAVGATVGGITGALIGMGIPEIEAKQYEGKIKAGNILISVHADNSEKVTQAKQIFRDANAQDISSTGETSVPDDEDTTTQNISAENAENDRRYSTTATGLAPVAGVSPIATQENRRNDGPYQA